MLSKALCGYIVNVNGNVNGTIKNLIFTVSSEEFPKNILKCSTNVPPEKDYYILYDLVQVDYNKFAVLAIGSAMEWCDPYAMIYQIENGQVQHLYNDLIFFQNFDGIMPELGLKVSWDSVEGAEQGKISIIDLRKQNRVLVEFISGIEVPDIAVVDDDKFIAYHATSNSTTFCALNTSFAVNTTDISHLVPADRHISTHFVRSSKESYLLIQTSEISTVTSLFMIDMFNHTVVDSISIRYVEYPILWRDLRVVKNYNGEFSCLEEDRGILHMRAPRERKTLLSLELPLPSDCLFIIVFYL